ncbi:hypothetical protein [Methanocella conradii]|uniref:hypothetical protein n=1 Tax=Methanocella conradii TaxID=1175444 RepID=UPI0024B35EBD|nr:hypothetical protein [Methanocella conradii]MDI6895887.1 hypothetical protein [Methanocella conradii]
MGFPYQQVVALLRPHIVESSGLNLFMYPGTKDDFVDNLENMGVERCVPRYALRFEGHVIDLDLLFYIVDVLKTKDGGVIFYSPESRILDFKLIMRPAGGLDELCLDT